MTQSAEILLSWLCFAGLFFAGLAVGAWRDRMHLRREAERARERWEREP